MLIEKFSEKFSTSDRAFVAVLVVAVLGTLLGIRLYANHLRAEQAARRSLPSATQAPRNVLRLEAITHVYECERDGQRVLSDHPCGTGVEVQIRK
jgi:hypothetical protein